VKLADLEAIPDLVRSILNHPEQCPSATANVPLNRALTDLARRQAAPFSEPLPSSPFWSVVIHDPASGHPS
jgi:hypothetical protein